MIARTLASTTFLSAGSTEAPHESVPARMTDQAPRISLRDEKDTYSQAYRAARFTDSLTDDDLVRLAHDGVDAVTLSPENVIEDPHILDRISQQVSLRGLTLSGYGFTGWPQISAAVLHGLESLVVHAEYDHPLPSAELKRVVTLRIQDGTIVGPLHDLPSLRALELYDVQSIDLKQLAGCDVLEHVHVTSHPGHRFQAVTLDVSDPPRALRTLDVDGGRLVSLEGVEGFRALRQLTVFTERRPTDPPTVDLSPLAHLTDLEVLAMARSGRLTHADALGVLPRIREVFAVRGWVEPVVPGVPFIWVPDVLS